MIAATVFLLNQQLPSFSATLLLSDIVLVLVVREAILASERAESSLLADQGRFADETHHLHMTSNVGLQAYHTQL